MSAPNQTERDAWNGDNGRRWVADADGRDRMLAEVSAALLERAAPPIGGRVLDIGCGCGATTIAAARAVDPGGAVVGVDIADPMLEVARRRVSREGLENVALLQADAQTDPMPGDHDLAISRFGTMFFDDPDAAFANIARAVRPGGRLAIATWQSLLANEWLVLPGAVLLRYGPLPESGTSGPGMFAQSDPGTIAAVLTRAGFTDVEVTPTTVALHLGVDLDGAVAQLTESGPGRAVLATIPPDQQPGALDAVREVLADHVDADGVSLDGAIHLTTATRR